MRKIRLAASGILVLLAVMSIQAHPASAIETSGIGALPAHPRADNPRTKSIFVYDVTAADIVTDGVKVVNNTDTAKIMAVYPVDSQASSDGAFACAQMVEPKKGVGSWIKLAQDEVTLAANSSQVVPFTLTVPKGITPGEHNGCIVVQDAAPATQTAGNGIVLSFRSALRVAVTTPGALESELSFVDVKSHDINKATLGVSPILQNKGNVSSDANIYIKITGLLWLHYPFADSGGQFPVFPGTISRFNFELKKPFWGGWYRREALATYRKPLSSGQLSDNVTTIRGKTTIIFIAPKPAALAIEIFVMLVLIVLVAMLARQIWVHHRLRHLPTKPYTVRKGETIDVIGSRFHISWRWLAEINHIKSPYTLHSGMVIKVPAGQGKPGSAKNNPRTGQPQGTPPPAPK